ncbi:glycosyltransferase [Nocardioides currus]|nr:glycosyltransferase [Nocardioides currus]
MFDDKSAASYIAARYGREQVSAFARCQHPAMRSDYLRLCVLLAEGGFYVDADDKFRGVAMPRVFDDGNLKVQPLCYDISRQAMVDTTEPGLFDHQSSSRIFYVNNNPIAARADDPVLRRALERATNLLLDPARVPEIQSTTGPGNFSAALAAHANECNIANQPLRLDLLFGWETIATPDWTLGYRLDDRNWRRWNDWSFENADPTTGIE